MARRHAATTADASHGYDADRSNRQLRPGILVNHWLHWLSSLIVMSIAAYFIDHFHRDEHLIYWVTIAAIDVFLYIPALVLPVVKSYKGYLHPLSWIFSYLWLTGFIFAAQDYNWHSCSANSPGNTDKCGLKKTLEAFAFLAFFTNAVGQFLEWKLWDNHRNTFTGTAESEKNARASADTAPTATTGTTGTNGTAPVATNV